MAAMREAASQDHKYVKILLSGTGDSGKTTLRKQMRNLYGEQFSEQERQTFVAAVHANLIDGILSVLKAMDTVLMMELATPQARAEATWLRGLPSPIKFTTEVAATLKELLADETFQTAVTMRAQFQLQDCWDSFANSVMKYPAWGGPAWLPTQAECISVRVRTSGIVEETLRIQNIYYKIYDVGGQRAERRKWLHSFEHMNAVAFVTAISEYDLVLFEDAKKNRLAEALDLFEEMSHSRYFANVPFMLFLNKRDVFEKKFMVDKVPLNISGLFPDAPSCDRGIEAASEWMIAKFTARHSSKSGTLYPHVTSALDPRNVRLVIDDVTQILVRLNLKTNGFVVE
jgi:guanine nucleotide-binding protein G(i) subunit alpha